MLAYHILLIIFLALSAHTQKPEQEIVVETEVLRPTTFTITRTYFGKLTTEKFTELTAKAVSEVDAIHVVPNQVVKPGQLLVSLRAGGQRRSLELSLEKLRGQKAMLERSRQLFSSKDIAKTELERREALYVAAEAEVEQARISAESFAIKAPFGGLVGMPRVVIGQTVAIGDVIITVRHEPFVLNVQIPGSRLGEIKTGQTIKVQGQETTIAAVDASIDAKTRMGLARANLPHCPGCIIGESVEVAVDVARVANAVVVKNTGIFYDHGQAYVIKIAKKDQGMVGEKVAVTIGAEYAGGAEITSGLRPGDEIVAINPRRVRHSAKVKIARPPEARE